MSALTQTNLGDMEVVASFNTIFSNATQDENFTAKLQTREYAALLDEFKRTLHTHAELSTLVLISLYVPVFLLALIGNLVVLLVVLTNRHMRSVTNCYIVNLALADILVTLVCIPVSVGKSVYKLWVYGRFMCKLSGYMQGVSVAASVFTIMMLSLDRYLAIRHPIRFRSFSNNRHIIGSILCIWLLAFAIMIPLILVHRLDVLELIPHEPMTFCNEIWQKPITRRIYDSVLFVLLFVIPGVFVFTSYSRIGCKLWTEVRALYKEDSTSGREQADKIMAGRRKVARILVILAIVFAVCWLPCHLLILYLDYQPTSTAGLSVLHFTIWMGHANSALNPVIYCFMNRSFRRCSGRLLHCKSRPAKKIRHKTPTGLVRQVNTGVCYSRMNGTQQTCTATSRPQRRPASLRSTTSGSVRFSRSTNTSFKSSHTSNRASPKDNKRKAVSTEDQYPVDLEINPQNSQAQSDSNSPAANNRREIFNCTLSIPTTINEETSRSSFSIERAVFKAVLEVSERDLHSLDNGNLNSGSLSEDPHDEEADMIKPCEVSVMEVADLHPDAPGDTDPCFSEDSGEEEDECEILLASTQGHTAPCRTVEGTEYHHETTFKFTIQPAEIVMQKFECIE